MRGIEALPTSAAALQRYVRASGDTTLDATVALLTSAPTAPKFARASDAHRGADLLRLTMRPDAEFGASEVAHLKELLDDPGVVGPLGLDTGRFSQTARQLGQMLDSNTPPLDGSVLDMRVALNLPTIQSRFGVGFAADAVAGGMQPVRAVTREAAERIRSNSVVNQTVFHATSPEAAASILRGGADATRGGGALATGFYTSTLPDAKYGGRILEFALDVHNPASVSGYLDAKRTVAATAHGGDVQGAVRERLLDLGHDSIVAPGWGDFGDDYIVALRGEDAYVVTTGAASHAAS